MKKQAFAIALLVLWSAAMVAAGPARADYAQSAAEARGLAKIDGWWDGEREVVCEQCHPPLRMSADGSQVAYVKSGRLGNLLVIRDVLTGKERTFPFFFDCSPRFSPDGKSVLAICPKESHPQLRRFDLQTGAVVSAPLDITFTLFHLV